MRWQDEHAPESSFPDALRRDFKRQKVDLKIIKKESDENTKYDLFERLNTLGSKLSDQEVRNCLLVMINAGFYTWLQELAISNAFQDTISLSDKALQERYDLELLLRFILLTRVEEEELRGIRDVDAFITKGMRQIANDPNFDRVAEGDVVTRTFSLLNEALGENSFTRQDVGRGRGGFLISLFEVIATGLGYRIRRSADSLPTAEQVRSLALTIGDNEDFRKHSRSGTSASSRMPRLVPFGRRLFASV